MINKIRYLFGAFTLTLLLAFQSISAVVTGLNNTGFGITAGNIDPSWNITVAPTLSTVGATRVPVANNPLWLPASLTSSWLIPQVFTNAATQIMPGGNYIYSINFSTTHTIDLNFKYAVDNILVGVSLSGPTTYNNTSLPSFFQVLSGPFTISNVLPGNYTMNFNVFNASGSPGPNPVGFRAEFTTIDVPEPMTYASLGGMLVLCLAVLKRRKIA